MPSPLSGLELGITQFNAQDFYACHDTLEAVWLESPSIDKRFYQGILQVAVGCYHLSNQNLQGAMILLGEGIQRLKHYRPDYQGVDVEDLLQSSLNLLTTLQALPKEQLNIWIQDPQNQQLIPTVKHIS